MDEATLEAARAGDRQALARVLAGNYPQVWRMSLNLIGDPAAGRRVARRIMTQSLNAADSWDHEDAPARWFRHHTVLATREVAGNRPPVTDVLLQHGPNDPEYAAFVRALRSLPHQQREAFLLHHGEGFDERQMATAMDCSVEAANVHMRGSTVALQPLAGDKFAQHVSSVTDAYQGSEPDRGMALQMSRRLIRPGFTQILLQVLGWLILLGLIVGLVYLAWWLHPRLVI